MPMPNQPEENSATDAAQRVAHFTRPRDRVRAAVLVGELEASSAAQRLSGVQAGEFESTAVRLRCGGERAIRWRLEGVGLIH